jgi:multiple sugar transport system substrate-binding protein
MKTATKLLIFVLLVASMLLSSCAQPTAAPTAEQPAAEQPAAEQPAATEAPAAEQPAATTECKDEDRVQINWSTIAGFYTDAMESIIADFEATHCIKVNIIGIDNAQLYDKQVIELVGKTGAYDVVNIEAMEKAEFAENGFLLPMDDYLKEHPEAQYEDIAPIIQDLTTKYKGKIWGLPYYTYTAGWFGRCDLLEDPTEQAAFKEKYGYDLAIPTTWEQHRDITEFFTRKAGDKLKGETLTKDFYGVGLMAGRFQEIQDELSAFIWAYGGNWLKDDGTLDQENVTKALKWYVEELLPYAPPAALTVTYDGVMNQM